MEPKKIKRKHRRPSPLRIGFNNLGIDESRKVLYRNFHEVSGLVYLVEISRKDRKVFIVLFEHHAHPHLFKAESLNEKVAHRLLSEHNNSFEQLVGSFYVKFGKL